MTMAADLSDYPLLPLVLASLIVILVASELGRWTGAHAHARAGGQVTTLESAIFGLLALMIGFTFSVALSRFEARRHAVLSEANAIGTMALRVRLLPAPHEAEMLRLLRDYIRVRLRFARHFPTSAELEGAIAKSNELHEALWQHAMAGIAKEQLSVPAYLIGLPSLLRVGSLIRSRRAGPRPRSSLQRGIRCRRDRVVAVCLPLS